MLQLSEKRGEPKCSAWGDIILSLPITVNEDVDASPHRRAFTAQTIASIHPTLFCVFFCPLPQRGRSHPDSGLSRTPSQKAGGRKRECREERGGGAGCVIMREPHGLNEFAPRFIRLSASQFASLTTQLHSEEAETSIYRVIVPCKNASSTTRFYLGINGPSHRLRTSPRY